MSTLQKAISIAVEAHEGQVDKGGNPYILHPLRVMMSLRTIDEMIVGVLHDVVEDLELFRSKSENTSTKSRKELPAGWTSLHTDDGHDYFYNVDTGETVWELAG